MAENEPSATVDGDDESATLMLNSSEDEEMVLLLNAGTLSNLLPMLPNPSSALVEKRRLVKNVMLPIQYKPIVHNRSMPADPSPAVLMRRSTRSHQFKRKHFDCMEVDNALLFDETAANIDSGGHQSMGQDTTKRMKLAGKVPAKEPTQTNTRNKDEEESKPAVIAVVTGTSDGTVNHIMTMCSMQDSDDDNLNDQYTIPTAAVVESRTKKIKCTTKSVPAQIEWDNQNAPFAITPPTPFKRQSTLRNLSRGASIAFAFAPSLTYCSQRIGFLTKEPDDAATTMACEDQSKTEQKPSVMDRYRSIVPQWPPLAVQINKASVRTRDGRIIVPPLLPSLATTIPSPSCCTADNDNSSSCVVASYH